MKGNEKGHLMECAELNVKFIIKSETCHILNENIASILLKV